MTRQAPSIESRPHFSSLPAGLLSSAFNATEYRCEYRHFDVTFYAFAPKLLIDLENRLAGGVSIEIYELEQSSITKSKRGIYYAVPIGRIQLLENNQMLFIYCCLITFSKKKKMKNSFGFVYTQFYYMKWIFQNEFHCFFNYSYLLE